MPSPPKKIPIRIFRFLQLTWTEILTGQLYIDPVQKSLKIYYNADSSTNDHLIPDCPPSAVEGGRKLMEISVARLSKIEQDDTDGKIVYLWVDVNPFSISFLSEQKAGQACQVLQLIEQNMQITENQDFDDTSLEYIKNILESNHGMISTLFVNSHIKIVDQLFKTISLSLRQELTPEQKQNFFYIVKTALKVGDKKVMEKLIDDYYEDILIVLSWNPFNKVPFDYLKEYNKRVNFNNILGITDKIILGTYQENAKIKFLRDVAACSFIQLENERIFSSTLNANNQTILLHLTSSEKVLTQLTALSTTDPKSYLNIFAQLWEIYKGCNFDYENRAIKEDFYEMVKARNLGGLAVQAAYAVVGSKEAEMEVTGRFHQKWIQAFNPFLSYNWEYSQEWLMTSTNNQCLLNLLYKLVSETEDDGLIQAILGFVRWFVEPSQNRIKMQCKFKTYVYSQFISKIWPRMQSSVSLTQIFIDLILKLYKADLIRTRRTLIETRTLYSLDKQILKKPILICIIKLLDTFMEGQNYDIFVYLRNHCLFSGLREEYLRNASSKNIVNSCFRSLLGKVKVTKCQNVRMYFQDILLNKHNSCQ